MAILPVLLWYHRVLFQVFFSTYIFLFSNNEELYFDHPWYFYLFDNAWYIMHHPSWLLSFPSMETILTQPGLHPFPIWVLLSLFIVTAVPPYPLPYVLSPPQLWHRAGCPAFSLQAFSSLCLHSRVLFGLPDPTLHRHWSFLAFALIVHSGKEGRGSCSKCNSSSSNTVRSLLFLFNVDEMPQGLNACLYQLTCSQIGFVTHCFA